MEDTGSFTPTVRELFGQEEVEIIHKALKSYQSKCYSTARSKLKGIGSSTVIPYFTAEAWEEKGDLVGEIISSWEEHVLS